MESDTGLSDREGDVVLDKLYLIEQGEWERVNKDLRTHGMPSVSIVHPTHATKCSDVVVMEPEVARTLRQTLQHLMRDCDRRQELVQELIITNNSLREELVEQAQVSRRYEARAKDLKILLDSSNDKLQELETERLSQSSFVQEEEDKLRNTKTAAVLRCKQLQQKCEIQEEEMERLREKIKRLVEEDERRLRRQSEVFEQIRKNTSRTGSMDDRLVQVIDSYERQIHNLKKDLDIASSVRSSLENNMQNLRIEDSSPNFKAMIKTYERDLKETKRKLKKAENENELIKLEMDSRPEMKDFRAAQMKIKKLEQSLKKKKYGSDDKNGKRDNNKYSTQVEDIEYLPASHCHVYLKTICDEFAVSDVESIIPKVQRNRQIIEAYPRLEQFAHQVLQLTESSGVPAPPQVSSPSRAHKVWCEKTWHHVVPTLEHWLKQIHGLKELQQSLNKLTAMLSPNSAVSLTGELSTVKLICAVDTLIHNENVDLPESRHLKSGEKPSRAVLQAMVDHFMSLFDVKSLAGVYARMNDLYSKLGEVHNVMKTLKDLLGLKPDAKSTVVVDFVAQLTQSCTPSAQQIQELLKVDDISVVIRKLEEHEEFFPIFHEMLTRLLEILDVSRIDEILPAVRTLKVMVG